VKRFIVSCLLVLGGLLASCTETDDPAPRSILEGTFDLTQVDKLVFVTSTDRDELRVLELAEDAEARDFLRAPNPLQPLAIPVLDRPQALARDVSYDKDTPDSEEDTTGREVLGPYVYARSNGSEEISVVGATPGSLRELRTLSAEGPVTAFAGRGPTNSDNNSVLYFATQEATGGRLWRVVLVGPDSLNDETPLDILELKGAGGESLVPAGEAVTSLLVLSQSQGADRIVFSTRGTAGLTGQTFLLNVQGAMATATPLAFGGPVLRLATHAKVVVAAQENQPEFTLPAGQLIFGVLDAASCSAQLGCTGVLAVDSTTRQVAQDISERPMLPIQGLGFGLPMGLTLASNVEIRLQEGSTPVSRLVPLLGIVPLSNGEILFFNVLKVVPVEPNNAENKSRKVIVDPRTFDVDTEWADKPEIQRALPVTYLPVEGGSEQVTNLIIVEATTNGVTRNETYELVYQGVLPGLESVPREEEREPMRFKVPASAAANVQVGDLLILQQGPRGTACTESSTVTTIEPPVGEVVTLVTTSTPGACVDYSHFEVRAGGDTSAGKPLVLSSTEGFLGRLGQGERWERQGPFFFHPEPNTQNPTGSLNQPDPDGNGQAVAVRFHISALKQGTKRGDRYLVTTLSRYQPFATTIDTTQLGLGAYRVPGAVVQAEVGNIDYAYIAYPSANGILQVNLETITADVPTAGGLRSFE
jgi:hypothetical protein